MTREPAYKLDLPHIYSGKVRDIYDAGNNQYLMVTSDRISAFDVVMNQPVPDKGRVLMAMSAFWFQHFSSSMKSHLVSTDLSDFPSKAQVPEIAGRSMLVKKVEMLPIECIVRGYITGSAWKEYKEHGTMHGASLPTNLQESEKLPEPVFTPSTKAAFDKHPVRDFLDGLDWDKSPPPPERPEHVISASAKRYREGYEKISGKNLDDWPS